MDGSLKETPAVRGGREENSAFVDDICDVNLDKLGKFIC